MHSAQASTPSSAGAARDQRVGQCICKCLPLVMNRDERPILPRGGWSAVRDVGYCGNGVR